MPQLILIDQSVVNVDPARSLVTLDQSVVRLNPAETLVTLDQSVVNVEPARSLVTLDQSIVRLNPAETLVTLDQAVVNVEPARSLVTLDQSVIYRPITDWEALAPSERRAVYVFDVGGLEIPIGSAQATMRKDGQSFLQAVIPNAGEWVDGLAALSNETMTLRKGYRYADDTLSPLEAIAAAKFETSRSDEGAGSHSMTVSGYSAYLQTAISDRVLSGVSYRSIDGNGRRRVRAEIDLFLQPGHTAIDSDATELSVATIQYFIGPASEFMEVLDEFVPATFVITFDTLEYQDYLTGDWVVDASGDFIASANIADGQESVMTLALPFPATVIVTYKVSSEDGYDFFVIEVNGTEVFSDSGDKSATWLTTSFMTQVADNIRLLYRKDGSYSNYDDAAYIQQISVVP